jgi:predicted transcriptional regulator
MIAAAYLLIVAGSHACHLGSRFLYCVYKLQTVLQQRITAMSRTLSVRLPDDLYDELYDSADSEGISRSEWLTRAIYNSLRPPVSTPQPRVNSAALSERLATIEARLTALEQTVSRDPHLAGMTVKGLRKLSGRRGSRSIGYCQKRI